MRSDRRRGFQRAFVLSVAALAALACAKIVGGDRYQIIERLEDAGDAGICAEGEFRCTGAALQICRDDLSGFRTAQVCATPELCCPEATGTCERIGCKVPECAAGDYRCREAILETCNDGLTGWIPIDDCTSPSQCNATLGRCTDAPCNPAPQNPDFQCNGPALEQCGSSGWSLQESCESRSLCTSTPPEPGCASNGCLVVVGTAMQPSGYECANADLRRCNAGRTGFEYVETCVNAANCIAQLGKASGTLLPGEIAELGCSAPVCIAGTYRCDEATLQRCDPNRLAYTEQEECSSPSHCNASLGRCEPQPCVPGTRQCSANELWLCTPEQTWTTERVCADGERCDALSPDCVDKVCDAAEYQCDGTLLQRCNVDGSGWIPVHACATSELCNAATKRCEPPVCEPGRRRCSRDGKHQVCKPGLDGWDDLQNCAALAVPPVAADSLLVAGVCDLSLGCLPAPTCTSGARRCNGQFLERCEGNTWHPQERCLTATLCDANGAGSCRAPTCQPGEYRCVMPAAVPVVYEPNSDVLGLTLEQCNTSGTGFETVLNCAGTYCDAVHGQCDLCDAYTTLCEGDTLKRCSADGQEKEVERYCSAGCLANNVPAADAGTPPAMGPAAPTAPACAEDPMAPNGAN